MIADNALFVKWEEHKSLNGKVADRLHEIGEKGRSERMRDCAQVVQYKHCPQCDTWHVAYANLCRDRLCPVCNWRLAVQRYGEMRRVLDGICLTREALHWSFLTLTVPNCQCERLSGMLGVMAKTWNRMTVQRWYQPKILGWARSVEVTYNAVSGDFHPHYHVILCWDGMQFCEKDGARLEAEWLRLLQKEGVYASISAQSNKTIYARYCADGEEPNPILSSVLETFKYAVKSSDVCAMPLDAFRCLVYGLKGKRLVSSGGIIKEVARELSAEFEQVKQTDVTVCSRCGSPELEECIYRWAQGINKYVPLDRASGGGGGN